jgi:hypothetical protein
MKGGTMPAAIPKVTVIKELTTITPAGQTERSYNVAFTVGDQGPFTVTIPGPQFSADAVKTAMQKTADEINKLIPGA